MQNRLKILLPVIAFLLIAEACHKSGSVTVAPTALNIINAIPNSQPIIPILGTQAPIQYFGNAQSIGYTGSAVYSPLNGSNTLYIVQNTDTTAIDPKFELFNGTIDLAAGGIYSFFLAGDSVAPDTLFVQDQIPAYSDSSAGVRFVNLTTGSMPMSVTIEGNPATQAEFSNLAYKTVSSWKKYLSSSAVPGYYNFTIRDELTGDSLTSFSWNYALFKNNTLVISGSEVIGSNEPIQVFQMNNF